MPASSRRSSAYTAIGTYTYDVFGAARTQTGATTEWNYTGERNDPTGLEYLRARYYDNANDRFINRDALPLLQRYAYADNNPVNFTDPTGLISAGDISKIILASKCWYDNSCGPEYEQQDFKNQRHRGVVVVNGEVIATTEWKKGNVERP